MMQTIYAFEFIFLYSINELWITINFESVIYILASCKEWKQVYWFLISQDRKVRSKPHSSED